MNRIRLSLTVLSCSLFAALLILPLGCDIESGDEVVRTVNLNVSGVYRNGAGIADSQSGTELITSINIDQSGDQLFGVDNLGARWTGTINNVSGDEASVQLRGLTNTGVEVVITGTIKIEGTTGRLTGLWVEPNLRSNVSATAEVQAIPTATPTGNPTSNPTSSPTTSPTASLTPVPTTDPGFPPIPS